MHYLELIEVVHTLRIDILYILQILQITTKIIMIKIILSIRMVFISIVINKYMNKSDMNHT